MSCDCSEVTERSLTSSQFYCPCVHSSFDSQYLGNGVGDFVSELESKTVSRCPLNLCNECSRPVDIHFPKVKWKEEQCSWNLIENEDPLSAGNRKRSGSQKKKKKKKKTGTICLVNCKYNIVRKISKILDMKEVGEHDDWNVYWTDCFIPTERAKEMKGFQRVNHFPGMSEICRKDLLARNLNRMLKFFPKEYNFFPKTFCLPADLGEAMTYSRTHRNKTFIIKPDLGCRGKGIFLTKSLKDLKPFERMICQVYISKPFLIDGFKFDLRIYTLITSCDPLRIYVYNEGLARFATSRYCEPAPHNTTNMYMHLTNYSVNKHSRTYVVDDEAGSKRRLSTVNAWLERKQYDVPKIWAAIDEIIVKTVIAAFPTLKHSYHTCFPGHEYTYACFELLGFDVLLDYKFKPYLLEVNHSPSFHTDAEIDKEVKESLLKDTFRILNLTKCDKKRVIEEDKQKVRNRLMQVIQNKDSPKINENNDSQLDVHSAQQKWEENHLGNYRLVYPCTDADKYTPYFHQTQSSLFQETFASKARGEAGKLQREEFELKLRGEAARRLGPKSKLFASESTPVSKAKNKQLLLKKKPNCNSFDPMPIIDSDEKERLAGLAQREFLLRSYRVVDQVNVLLKKSADNKVEKKESVQTVIKPAMAGVVDQIISKNKKNDSVENVNNTHSLIKGTILEPPLPLQKSNSREEAYLNDRWKTTRNCFFRNPVKKMMEAVPGLEILTNEATLRIRPDLPIPTEWPSTLGGKSTKAHIARHFSNTVKLHGLERRLSADKHTSCQ